MKKTFKKTWILLTVITVMMICALVFPASAADVCDGDKHVKEYEEVKITPPTCTDDGYSVDYCTHCKEDTSLPYDTVSRTGHSFVVIGYEADGDAFRRVVQCTNPECVRATEDTESVKNKIVKSEAVYHSVEFVNTHESPKLGEVENHKSYFLEYYYVESDSDTWVADGVYIDKTYAPAKKENTKVTTGQDIEIVIDPEYEYFKNAEGQIELYVLNGKKAVYNGETPKRCKDTEKGRYTFGTWVVGEKTIDEYEIYANTVFDAQFTAVENVSLNYMYMNEGRTISTTNSEDKVHYGNAVVYDGATPTKPSTAAYSYEFSGWRVDTRDVEAVEGVSPLKTPITLYHEAIIHAKYNKIANKYNIAFENYEGKPFYDKESADELVCEGVLYGGEVPAVNLFTDADIRRPKDSTYVYVATGKWEIVKVNGYKLSTGGGIEVDLHNIQIPENVSVSADGSLKTINHSDYEEITVTPVYNRQIITYTIPVSIEHVYFETEDLYDKDTPRSDILKNFVIQVYTGKGGRFLTAATTDANGKATIKVNYSEQLYITAVSESGKYFGETTIPMSRAYSDIEFTGISIAPSLSEEWLNDNTHSCGCICHSILSTIVIKIYNFIYRLFGVKIVCCDDLFIAHGSVLAYMK